MDGVTASGAKRTFVASNHERVTNGTMARSSARRSIKRKGRRHAADIVLQLPVRLSAAETTQKR
jgi:hypothetical protein